MPSAGYPLPILDALCSLARFVFGLPCWPSCVLHMRAEGSGIHGIAFDAASLRTTARSSAGGSSPGGFEGADDSVEPSQAVETADVTGDTRVGLRRMYRQAVRGQHFEY